MGSNVNPTLLPEIGPDGLPREAPVIAYTEKIIEEEKRQLKKYIEENYSKIRDVEREFANLTLELKLTAGSKNAAFEHMRKKIEVQNEIIHAAKVKEEQARKAWEAASKVVKDEEAVKQKLCEDLNQLVQESNNSQYARLEELKRRLEALNPGRASMSMFIIAHQLVHYQLLRQLKDIRHQPILPIKEMVKTQQPLITKINRQLMEKGEERRRACYMGKGKELEHCRKGEGLKQLGGQVLDLMWMVDVEKNIADIISTFVRI